MVQFSDLQFKPKEALVRNGDPHAVQARYEFPNGDLVSVVRNKYSYGGPEGLYELMVMCTVTDEHIFDTPATPDYDAAGWLSEADVTRALQQIDGLPRREVDDALLRQVLLETREAADSLHQRLRETQADLCEAQDDRRSLARRRLHAEEELAFLREERERQPRTAE